MVAVIWRVRKASPYSIGGKLAAANPPCDSRASWAGLAGRPLPSLHATALMMCPLFPIVRRTGVNCAVPRCKSGFSYGERSHRWEERVRLFFWGLFFICARAHTHAHIQACTDARTYIHAHAHTYAHRHAGMHTRLRTYRSTPTHEQAEGRERKENLRPQPAPASVPACVATRASSCNIRSLFTFHGTCDVDAYPGHTRVT